MKRFLDILLILLITMFVVNIFSSKKEEKLSNILDLGFIKNSYTIPASVGIFLNNGTDSVITINTCNDLNILSGGEKITFGKSFCEDLKIESGENFELDLSSEYSLFSTVGKYVLNAKIGEKEYIDQFELEHKGAIKKTFVGLIYAPIYNLVIWLIELFKGSFGWAIIGITFIIRGILLWPQQRMMLSQRKLQAIQPKIKKIQEEFKGNQQMLGKKMMELYKKEKVNPVGSCGFLLIQMPILLVVYNIVRGIQDPSNIYYLYGFLDGFNLSSIDFSFYSLDLLASKGIQGILLALFVAIIQFLQIKLSMLNKKKQETGKDIVLEKKSDKGKYSQVMPDPEMMNKFMLFGMPVMVGVFTYTLSAGIGIYWGISTLFMLFQQLIVNKIVKK